MDLEKIENKIIQFFFQSANMEDLDILNEWIESPENQLIFKEYVKTNYAITLAITEPEIETIREEFLLAIKQEKKTRKTKTFRLRMIMRYAAAVLLFLGVGFTLYKNLFCSQSNQPVILPSKDKITLTLGNGDIRVIDANGTSKVYDANGKEVGEQKGKELTYSDDGTATKLVYNTLKVPYGKRFNITLSDGTIVHLNAGSSMTFPVQFLKNSIRKVALSGEAFFEVAHNKKNAFIVNANRLNVQVYGTKFNVKNYLEDNSTDVVLIEGSVGLSQAGMPKENKNEVFLSPGHKGTFIKADSKIAREKVNTSLYTSWMNGNLVFRNESFDNIAKKLERQYNVTIINKNEKLANETFDATIETDHETIQQVFRYFKKAYQIEYTISDNKIIIH